MSRLSVFQYTHPSPRRVWAERKTSFSVFVANFWEKNKEEVTSQPSPWGALVVTVASIESHLLQVRLMSAPMKHMQAISKFAWMNQKRTKHTSF